MRWRSPREASAQRYVPREDLDTRFNVVTQRRDDLQRLTDSRIKRVERDVDAIAKQVVPRGEHEQMWAAQRARDADLQRQADQNRPGLYDLNTPRDTIQGMQRRSTSWSEMRGRRRVGSALLTQLRAAPGALASAGAPFVVSALLAQPRGLCRFVSRSCI